MKKENRLVVADSGWAETIPEWIKEAIKEERIINGLIGIATGKEEVGNAEVLAYLYTANLHGPISHYLSEVFIYLTGICLQRHQKIKLDDLPDFCREKIKKGLSEDEKRNFEDLKRDLFRLRGGTISSPLLDVLRELKRKTAPDLKKCEKCKEGIAKHRDKKDRIWVCDNCNKGLKGGKNRDGSKTIN